jgi:DmsE family decaheme c-type cytochrome
MKRLFLLISTFVLALAPPLAADGADPCAGCHEGVTASTATAVHARVAGVPCERCHPAAAKHLEDGSTEGLLPDRPQTLCFSCHAGLACDATHCSKEEFTCSSCHCIHHGEGKAVIKRDLTRACESCHKEVKGEVALPNHHPVPEGKMTCVSCHNPHADFKMSEATGPEINVLCFDCHTSKQGPFVFEHAPVVEDCRICHNAHGSVADNLLVQNEPFLCLQCHEFHFHAGLKGASDPTVTVGGAAYPNPLGVEGYKRSFTTKCTQCHTAIHGSDLPTQTVTGRGRGLAR